MPPLLRGYSRREYFDKAMAFLTECRAKATLGGMWDPADLQWWWRDNEYVDRNHQLFLEDRNGKVLGFVLLSPSYMTFDYEILPGYEDNLPVAKMFRHALEWLNERAKAQHGEGIISFLVRDEHISLRKLAEAEGCVMSGGAHIQTVLDLRKAASKAPDLRVRSLSATDLRFGQPPIIGTSAAKFARVKETPMYRPEQHLVLLGEQSQPVAECIYWTDTANGTATFEPMETHPKYRRRGYGKALLRECLRRLSSSGVRLAKVSYYSFNQAAAGLYKSVGFEPAFERLLYKHVSR